jgi:hypothetical protein
MIEDPDQKLRVKASTKFVERRAKHSDRWALVKGLNCQIAEVHERIQWPDLGIPPILL